MPFRDRIRAVYDHFSPGYRKIADFLLDDYRTAAFLSASGIAQYLGVDPATVVRFAQRLGYTGYPELAEEVQALVKQELAAAFSPAPAADSPLGILREVLRSEAEDIQRLLIVNRPDVLEDLLNGILTARRVYLIAESNGSRIMEVAAVQLGLSGIDARVVKGDRAERSIALLDLGPQDIAIGLAPYLTVTEITGMLRATREAGLRTYAIVGGLSSPVARAADVVILAPKSYRSPLTAYSTPMALLTALAHVVAVQRPQVLTKSILNASELWTKMMRLDEPQMPDLEKFLEGWRLGEQNRGQNAS